MEYQKKRQKMKKCLMLALAISALVFSGCTIKGANHYPKDEYVIGLDFKKYQSQGFLITPGDYGEQYEALGIFEFTVYPEANFIEDFKNQSEQGKWEYNAVIPQDVLDLAYKEALKKSADGITHFKMKREGVAQEIYSEKGQRGLRFGISMSGLLIKRK